MLCNSTVSTTPAGKGNFQGSQRTYGDWQHMKFQFH